LEETPTPRVRFHVLTLFPGMFEGPFSESIIARARRNGLVEISVYGLRDYAHDRHRTVDDYPFGGGGGMVMKPEPLFEGVESVRATASVGEDAPTVLLSPQGRTLTQSIVEELAGYREMLLVCGRYEGVDERVTKHLATDEISVGDYVLGGGELAAMIVIEAVCRLIPGVVGSIESVQDDSFTTGLLQHPQYTRPDDFRGWRVPDVLTSGNHADVDRWRREESLRRTYERRPELLDSAELSDDDRGFLKGLRET
jgi:tRNA (guanine37-N1)-methyltransferase